MACVGFSIKIPKNKLARFQVFSVAAGVIHLHFLQLECRKKFPYFRFVIQGKNELPLNLAQQFCQHSEVLAAEEPFAIVVLAIPIWRVHSNICQTR